jgi:hypothetical protein
MIGFSDTLFIQLGITGNTALTLTSTFYSSLLHTHQDSQSSLAVSWQQIYIHLTELQITHEVFFTQSNPFLLNHLQLPSPELDPILDNYSQFRRLSSIPLLQAHILAGWRPETRINSTTEVFFIITCTDHAENTGPLLLVRCVYSTAA